MGGESCDSSTADVQEQLAAANEELQQAKARKVSLDRHLERITNEMENLHQESIDISGNLQEIDRRLQAARQSLESALKKHEGLHKEIERISSFLRECRSKNPTDDQEKRSQASKVNAETLRIARLRLQERSLLKYVSKQKNAIEALKKSKDEAMSKKKSAEQKINRLAPLKEHAESQSSEFADEIHELSRLVAGMEVEISASHDENTDLSSELESTSTNSLPEHVHRIEQLELECDTLLEQKRMCEQEKLCIWAELQSAKGIIAILECNGKDLESRFRTEQESLKFSIDELDRLRTENDIMQRRISEHDADRCNLKKELDDAVEELKQVAVSRENIQKELQVHQDMSSKSVANLEAEKKSLTAQLAQQNQDHNAFVKDAKERDANMSGHIGGLLRVVQMEYRAFLAASSGSPSDHDKGSEQVGKLLALLETRICEMARLFEGTSTPCPAVALCTMDKTNLPLAAQPDAICSIETGSCHSAQESLERQEIVALPSGAQAPKECRNCEDNDSCSSSTSTCAQSNRTRIQDISHPNRIHELRARMRSLESAYNESKGATSDIMRLDGESKSKVDMAQEVSLVVGCIEQPSGMLGLRTANNEPRSGIDIWRNRTTHSRSRTSSSSSTMSVRLVESNKLLASLQSEALAIKTALNAIQTRADANNSDEQREDVELQCRE